MYKSLVRLFESRLILRHLTSKTALVEPQIAPVPPHEEDSVLGKCNEDISHIAPYLQPSFNLAAYVNKSETLKQLVHLGVELYKLEKNPEVPPFLLRLDFERDIKNHILFLHDLGVETESIARIFTRNPFILKHGLDDLQVRVKYLKSKKFDADMIKRVVEGNPEWLTWRVQDIDERLGFFQKTFALKGKQIRSLATTLPKLITYDMKKIKRNIFVMKEEMCFNYEQMKTIVLATPTLLIKNDNFLLKTFEYLHKTMQIDLDVIVKMPRILLCREARLKQRHMFLEKLGKIQFDPKQPNYISPATIVEGNDAEFSTEVAKSSVQTYNAFLKTL